MYKDSWELYVHFPFCVKKCNYCDFLSYPIDKVCSNSYASFLEQDLLNELNDERFGLFWKEHPVRSVFFGGGTPSLMENDDLSKFLRLVKANLIFSEDAEITIEANPGTFTKEKVLAWRQAGINRVSVGVQAFDDTLLKRLGRIHSSSTAYAQIKLLHECGFDNISLDLIFGLPGQTLSMWQDTLKVACELPIQHISCYSLIVEEGTRFYQDYQTGLLTLPDEETERQMAHFAISYLKEHGFYQYEISNFSKKGFESIHNNGYWEGVPYLGLGLGASSLAVDQNGDEWRFSKTKNYKEYCHSYSKEECSKLSLEDRMSEYVFLGLRKTCGISRKEFIIRFGRTIESVYGEALRKHLQDGLLQQIDDRYLLTGLGLDLANQVMEDFV